MNLVGKVAVITGGAMGNGLGIVKTFLKYGAKVIILDYSEEIRSVLNIYPGIIGYRVDIKDNENVLKVINSIGARFGRIDILVNNAGVCKLASFTETDEKLRDFHFDINIKGTWNVTQACLKYMSEGSIINLSSVTGVRVADVGEVAYATTKAAIIGFTKSLAIELASRNIRVNAILPGYIDTPMVLGIAKDSNSKNPNRVIEGIASSIPMKRLGTIEEIGDLTAFLASNLSSYITGSEFVIDGGSTLPETTSVGI